MGSTPTISTIVNLNGLLNIFFPRRCVVCGRYGVLSYYKTTSYLCRDCFSGIEKVEYLRCPYCGLNSPFGRTHNGCLRKFGLDGLITTVEYRGVVRKIVKEYKYRFITDLAPFLAEFILRRMFLEKGLVDFLKEEKFLVTCVPLFGQREKWRGYNQSEILGRILAKRLGLEFSLPLLRMRKTTPQVDLDYKKRYLNVKGVFSLKSLLVKERNILLVDDVWTTGATMKNCAMVLKRGGAGAVWGLVIAG